MNALAASAVATVLKIKPELIADALGSARPPKMRGEITEFAKGFKVVDDSYNSNPRSLRRRATSSLAATLRVPTRMGRRVVWKQREVSGSRRAAPGCGRQ